MNIASGCCPLLAGLLFKCCLFVLLMICLSWVFCSLRVVAGGGLGVGFGVGVAWARPGGLFTRAKGDKIVSARCQRNVKEETADKRRHWEYDAARNRQNIMKYISMQGQKYKPRLVAMTLNAQHLPRATHARLGG